MEKKKNTITRHSGPSPKQRMSYEELEERLSRAFGEPITLERKTKDQKPNKQGTSIQVMFIKKPVKKDKEQE